MRRFWDHRRMILKLHSQRLQTVDEIRSLLDGATTFDFEPQCREEAYAWMRDRLHGTLFGPATRKLCTLPDPAQYLKPGLTPQQLHAIATQVSDNEAAQRVNETRNALFRTINNAQHHAA